MATRLAVLATWIGLCAPVWASDPPSTIAAGESRRTILVAEAAAGPSSTNRAAAPDEEDLATIGNKQINPISDLWSLVFQHDTTIFDNDDDPFSDTRAAHSFKFQPVLPMELTEEISLPTPFGQEDQGLRLINRPVFELVSSRPIPKQRAGGGLDIDQETAFGDLNGVSVIGPARKQAGGFFYGGGLTWGFPTASASRDVLSTQKYILGPAAVAFLFTKSWVFGVFPQQQFSIAGKKSREKINRLNLQYFLLYQVPNTQWKIGMTPDIRVDWEARSGDKLTIPVGLGATTVYKIGNVPVRVLFEAQGFVERPDTATPLVNFRVLIAPVITKPKWARKPLF